MLEKELNKILETSFGKDVAKASNEEIYRALLELTKEKAKALGRNKGSKKLYYISAEFLIGKLLSNNLINLGLYGEAEQVLRRNGKELSAIEELEPEPSLGNGGLGRLAACFLDSIATLGLNGDGVGLNYHCGLFKQEFSDHKQKEVPNPWIEKESWLEKTDIHFEIPFKDFSLTSSLYDIDVTGYDSCTNKLHLFDVDSVDEGIVKEGICFDKEDIRRNLTLFLYPDDSDEKGQLLRIYQQYFMVSNAAQLILKECKEKGYDLYKLDEHVVVQINDTHPSMVIPELIRLLQQEGMSQRRAIEVVSRTCAYTNHTILAEALEKWPISYLEQVVPHLLPIIRELNARVREDFADPRVSIIDDSGRVHMAHMDIHYGFSVNGVAALHTEILKESELKPFYDLYPEKFNNKTNGITFRRWLLHCNPKLTGLIERLIGSGFKKNADELKKLRAYEKDEQVLRELLQIKLENKQALKAYLRETQNIRLDENSIFDIQIKRLHEYKRQQMNALYIIHKYLEIKAGKVPKTPITMIFGAKAAPAYVIAKDIIHLILCLQAIIDRDAEVKKHLNVVMVENYNVTKASKLIPACDVSEQISLASKEASGTGNMKFMLNGAVTLGTEDGANVEIHQLVGEENIYIFGESSQQVIEHYAKKDYCAKNIYEADGEIRTKDQAFDNYRDRMDWAKKMLVNISEAGYFSSDRTIKQYNEEIWHL